MPQHRFAHSSAATTARARHDYRRRHAHNEVTEIIPLDGFDDLDSLDFVDDFVDLDGLVFKDGLVFNDEPEFKLNADPRRDQLHDPDVAPDVTKVPHRGGQRHRKPTTAARGRLLISAMAIGGIVSAVHTATVYSASPRTETVLTANESALIGGSGANAARGVQVVATQPTTNITVHNEELAKGVAFAEERAQREARLQQPLYVMPVKGIFTSSFGYRWGVLHTGIDLANGIGTPILAVSDGVVIDVGPTAGYGMWVKLRHADGTVTLYGHVNTTLVSIGQRVLAGDQIATMGNRGYSTGPHLHFEVLLNGTERVDPVPWLAKRGLHVGVYAG